MRLHSSLWRDSKIDELFEPTAEISALLGFEAALAKSQAAHRLISDAAATAVAELCATFTPDLAALNVGIARDGMVVPELVSQLRAKLPEEHRGALHFRSTSQDAIDTCLVLQLRGVIDILEERLGDTLASLDNQSKIFADVAQMGRTRMQRALPLKVGDRIAAWKAPFQRQLERLGAFKTRLLVLQIGGPIGTDPSPWAIRMGELLELCLPQRSWHTARDELANFASWLSLVSGSAGKIAADIAMMAQNEIGEVTIAGGGRSSAMHHKSNPVQAEVLIAIGRYNAALLGGFHQSLIHEQERSGSAWALEWMILPEMASNAGASLQLLNRLLKVVSFQSGNP